MSMTKVKVSFRRLLSTTRSMTRVNGLSHPQQAATQRRFVNALCQGQQPTTQHDMSCRVMSCDAPILLVELRPQILKCQWRIPIAVFPTLLWFTSHRSMHLRTVTLRVCLFGLFNMAHIGDCILECLWTCPWVMSCCVTLRHVTSPHYKPATRHTAQDLRAVAFQFRSRHGFPQRQRAPVVNKFGRLGPLTLIDFRFISRRTSREASSGQRACMNLCTQRTRVWWPSCTLFWFGDASFRLLAMQARNGVLLACRNSAH